MKTVLVITPDKPTLKMFADEGWLVTTMQADGKSRPMPDLLCFTGGSDVSPYLYGEENVSSNCDPVRDEYEKQVYESFVGKVPMVGICRGGQFLNVMNGGSLKQHLGFTVSGDHEMYNQGMGYTVRVDHHQGIIPAEHCDIIYTAVYPASEAFDNIGWEVMYVGWYPDTRCLCFQPHPEWGHEPTRELFFKLIEEYIG